MQNISGFSLSAAITASKSFSSGFVVNQFTDDTDPLDSPDLQLAEVSFGLNGDMMTWSRASGIEVAIGIIPDGEDDKNLQAIVLANRVGKNKSGARDVINIVFTYPDGKKVSCSNGVMTTGPGMTAIASSGRSKSKVYRFRFENVTKTESQG